MWPFKTKAVRPSRSVPTLPFVGAEQWSQLGGGHVTPQASEALAAVASCVSLISETIAALPAVVALADDSRKVQPEHPLSRLVISGCKDSESWSDLVATLLASTLLRGNGLAEIGTDPRGQLMSLKTVPFQHCTAWQSNDGTLRFDYLPMTPPDVGKKRTLLRDEVVLLKDRSDGGVLGVPRLRALQTQVNSFRWMANAARPSGMISARAASANRP
jgi:phage portal protein BeeE